MKKRLTPVILTSLAILAALWAWVSAGRVEGVLGTQNAETLIPPVLAMVTAGLITGMLVLVSGLAAAWAFFRCRLPGLKIAGLVLVVAFLALARYLFLDTGDISQALSAFSVPDAIFAASNPEHGAPAMGWLRLDEDHISAHPETAFACFAWVIRTKSLAVMILGALLLPLLLLRRPLAPAVAADPPAA